MRKMSTEETRRLRRNLRDRNRRFRRMSPEQQRVRIAKDVIEQLEAERFKARTGTYLRPLRARTYDAILSQRNADVELGLLSAGEECHVCAIGAVFVAVAERADECPARNAWDSEKMKEYLGRWFSWDQLKAMESAFEGWGRDRPSFRGKLARSLGIDETMLTSDGVLRAIMENVVRNDGTFRQ